MKIQNENGMFWNEDNNGWTVSESAGTEYKTEEEAPITIGCLIYDDGGYYFDDETEPRATFK
jgi:hypothetical protein